MSQFAAQGVMMIISIFSNLKEDEKGLALTGTLLFLYLFIRFVFGKPKPETEDQFLRRIHAKDNYIITNPGKHTRMILGVVIMLICTIAASIEIARFVAGDWKWWDAFIVMTLIISATKGALMYFKAIKI